MKMHISKDLVTSKSSFLNKNSWQNLILDCFFTLIISIGFGVIVNLLFPFEATVFQIIWHMTLAVIIIAFLTRKVYILPSLILGIGVIGTLILRIFYSLPSFINYWNGFFEWWIKLFPDDSVYYTYFNTSLIKILVQLGIVLTVFILVRLIKSIYPIVIGALALIIAAVLQDYNKNELGIIIILIGLMPLLARNAYIDYKMIPNKYKKANILRPPFAVQFAALVVCVCCVISGVFIIPKDASLLSSSLTENIAADFQNATGLYSYSQKFFGNYSLSSIGLQLDSTELGGNIDLTSNTKVLRVYSKRKLLLKAYTYGIYDGETWSNDFDGAYRINIDNNYDEQDTAFSNNLFKNSEVSEYFNQLTKDDEITVTLLRSSSTLFTAGQLSLFHIVTPIKQPIQFNRRSEIFSYKPLPVNFTYKINSLFFTQRSYNKLEVVDKLENALENCKDTTYDAEGFEDYYTALPNNFSIKAKNIAAAITDKVDSPYEKLALLESYFKTSGKFTYTTKPGDIPKDRELVDYFLETQKGYCVYFATAMVTMARSLGIPSRMVSGYGMESDGENTWIVKAKFAHSWVECYIKGLGWIPFDPTPSQPYTTYTTNDDDVNTPEDNDNNNSNTDNPYTIDNDYPVDTPISQNVDSSLADSKNEEINKSEFDSDILIALIIILIILCIIKIITTKNYYCIKKVKKRCKTLEEQAEYYYNDILIELHLLEYNPYISETMLEFSERIMNNNLNLPSEINHTFEIMTKWRYGAVEPNEQDIEVFNIAHISIESTVKQNINKFKYILLRRLLLNTAISKLIYKNTMRSVKKPIDN